MDPVERPVSASHDCSVSGAIARQARCVVEAVAKDRPDQVALFDVWHLEKIDTGDNVAGDVKVRVAEGVRIVFTRKRARFYQDGVGVHEQIVERALLVPPLGLKPNDVLVEQRDGANFNVVDAIVNSGVESLSIQRQGSVFQEPPPSRGTLRMLFAGAQIA